MSEDNVTPVVNQSEIEARSFGWVPQDEYKGNQEDWKDADTFLRRGKEINGFLRKDMEKVNAKLSQRDAELAEIRETVEEFRKYHNETEARAYKKALDDLKKQKVEAIEQGDGVRVVEIDDEIDKYKEAQKPIDKPKPKADSNNYDAEYVEWATSNTWYVTSPELKQLAELFGQEITAKSPEKKGKAFLDEVTQKVKEAAPEFFENPARRNGVVSTSSDGRNPGTKTKKSYNDLPAEAKAACDKFVKQKLMTQEQYVSEYDWS